jgi:DNA-binding transcriptional MocR family regulator
MEADIQSGRLGPGARLPPQRSLAKDLGVDLTTVTRAFNEARRRGLIDATTGRGSFVRAAAPELNAVSDAVPPAIDLSMNMPPQPAAAKLQEHIREGIAAVLSSPYGLQHLHYQDSAGSEPDRLAAAHWLGQRLRTVPTDRVIITAGAQAALFGIMRILLQPGDLVCVPSLTYSGLRIIAERIRLRLHPLSVDDQGIVPASFEEACQREKPSALYCVPTIDNPTTATLPPERRQELVRIARCHGVAIIEDDAYGTLPRKPPAPLAALAPDLVWHIATLSKCATPALRIAYVAAPTLSDSMRLTAEVQAMARMAPPLMAALASRWIQDGTLEAITAAIREESAARQAIARRVLQELPFHADPDGYHLWLTLPDGWHHADLGVHARQSGLALVPASTFALGPVPEAVRIALGAAQGRIAVERGLSLLATALSHSPHALSSIV